MTTYFLTPPLVKDRPPFLPDSTELQRELWRHFENRERGVNVWMLSDGSVVQDTATAENSNTNMANVYPWDGGSNSAPYVRSIFIQPGANPQIPTETDVSHSVQVTAFFSGGSTHQITLSQYNALLAYTSFGNGYADCLTTGP